MKSYVVLWLVRNCVIAREERDEVLRCVIWLVSNEMSLTFRLESSLHLIYIINTLH